MRVFNAFLHVTANGAGVGPFYSVLAVESDKLICGFVVVSAQTLVDNKRVGVFFSVMSNLGNFRDGAAL